MLRVDFGITEISFDYLLPSKFNNEILHEFLVRRIKLISYSASSTIDNWLFL